MYDNEICKTSCASSVEIASDLREAIASRMSLADIKPREAKASRGFFLTAAFMEFL